MPTRLLAVDWSGDLRRARRKIWVAEATGGNLVRLEAGRDREELIAWLGSEAQSTPTMIVGLDFAFSFPAWFLTAQGFPTARSLWAEAARQGEDWLRQCQPPFWGWPGRKRAYVSEPLRHTDRALPGVGGIRPKSPFQIGGAGAVGTGSVRGMVALHRLCQVGLSVWPFDEPRLPVLIEIYPRLLTGAVRKSSRDARRAYIDERYPQIETDLRARAESCEDAFDAAVSALVMCAHLDEILQLSVAGDEHNRLEGEIWCPKDRGRQSALA